MARENESGKIGTFEQNLSVPAAQTEQNDAQFGGAVEPAGAGAEISGSADQGARIASKMASSPLEMNGETIVPSVTRLFTQNQTLYVFFQAYYPEKGERKEAFDANSLRAGLIFFRNGLQVNATPLLAPAAVDAKKYTGVVPHQSAAGEAARGRYTVQAVVIARERSTPHSAALILLWYPRRLLPQERRHQLAHPCPRIRHQTIRLSRHRANQIPSHQDDFYRWAL